LKTARFLLALLATNLRASFALRGAFWLQAGFMVANNLIFFSVWLIFFHRFDEIRGWRLSDMALLYGVAASGFGVAVIVADGVRDLARMIVEGDLDAYLTQPKPVLLQAAGSRTQPSGWGDVASGALLIGMSGLVTWSNLAWVLLAPLLGAAAVTSVAVLVCSLAFWIGPMGHLARQVIEFTILCACYPTSIFSGALRILIFTAIPAAFVSHLPAALIRGGEPRVVIHAVGGVAVLAASALGAFHVGLKRYASGNRFGVRA